MKIRRLHSIKRLTMSTVVLFLGFAALAESEETGKEPSPVSFYRQVRPIFQTNCEGCHQPAKAKGDYVMTDILSLLKGGDSDAIAVVPGKPEESYLVEMISPDEDGEVEMPRKGDPLDSETVSLIRRWILEGAEDDTPANAVQKYDLNHPPVYRLPPVITSLDYSPDGRYLAIAGFHEVLLHHADGSGLDARLIGLSARIESIKFSPDGKRLAVTGGLPARMGEIQIWDVDRKKLNLSVPITYDTVYGASWSPDGTRIAFGCSDSTVRAIDSKTGEEILFQGAHDDWVLDTVFSVKGDHIISVSRDRTVKLTEFDTQRFVDNITSITPGALAGGVSAVDRHPLRDEILVGGADGTPRIFRVFRQSKRVIGDNANLIRKYPSLKGRIFSVDFSRDGKRIAVGSSYNGKGYVHVYSSDYDSSISEELKKVFTKVSTSRSADERKLVEDYHTGGTELLASLSVDGGIYAVSFSPDGEKIAVAGRDGVVRILDAESAALQKALIPIPLPESEQNRIIALTVQPESIELSGPFEYAQTVVTAWLASGGKKDVTRMVRSELSEEIVKISKSGMIRPKRNGVARLVLNHEGSSVTLPIKVTEFDAEFKPRFITDVMPVLSKLGCNAGTCHGAKAGKNGFKLSLRGYDPEFDVRAFTDDLAGRRVNVASPDDSLMLLKASGAVPHEGGQRTLPGEDYYRIIQSWIAEDCPLDRDSPKVVSIRIHPENPVVQSIDDQQQLRVIGTYPDGSTRDVTAETFITSGNTDVAESLNGGLVASLRRGEAPLLARYEGAYASTTLTVMGDRSGFQWNDSPAFNQVDELVYNKLKRMKTLPSELCTDDEFLRRIYLDLIGLPPTSKDVTAFLADKRESGIKRTEVIDRLIGNKDFVDHWTNRWADFLQVNRKFLGAEGAAAFRKWIRNEIEQKTPYDEFTRKILTASGSNKDNPAASYYKILRNPQDIMENTTHLFLATRFSCNKCHDHPFERWTQNQYYEMSAFFAQVALKKDPASGDRTIGGTAVEGRKPFYEVIFDKDKGDVKHAKTGLITAPRFPFLTDQPVPESATRRERLANWITSPENPYFASSYVNRIWGYLTGVGMIEPLDDIRAGNPPSNPELLEWLTDSFVQSGFNVEELIRTICSSRTYQLSIKTNSWNVDDQINFSHAKARRLPAEVLYDAIYQVTGSVSKFPGVEPGTRAAQLPDVGVKLADGFLATLGRPARESACECERSGELQLGPIMSLISGPTVDRALTDSENILVELAESEMSDSEVIQELFLRILNRPATEKEVQESLSMIETIDVDHEKTVAELVAYEMKYAPIFQQRILDREEAIITAREQLAQYETEIAPREAELDAKQAKEIAGKKSELKAYESTLPQKTVSWEHNWNTSPHWVGLVPESVRSTNGSELVVDDDHTIFASGENGKGEYVITARSGMEKVTGVRLELLTDDRLPKKGPGRFKDGNFVLTEFIVEWAGGSPPETFRKVTLQNAKADFSQKGFDVETAIDGKVGSKNNGWGSHPKLGVNRVAVFEFKEPIEKAGDAAFKFTLKQNYLSNKHSIGKFRISLINGESSLEFGVPNRIGSILKIAQEQRSEEEQKQLIAYVSSTDKELQKRQDALKKSEKPRSIDLELKSKQETLVRMEEPLIMDPDLKAFRRAADLSYEQTRNKRLTAAQDIAWALINNPAFLFNH